MKVTEEFPPNFEAMKKAFPLCEEKKAVFCYEKTIYNPFGSEIPADMIAHEAVHSKQQEHEVGGVEAWYYRYINDLTFRYEQELEAYSLQYVFAKRHIKDREAVAYFLRKCSDGLASPLYGFEIGPNEAARRIREFSKGM